MDNDTDFVKLSSKNLGFSVLNEQANHSQIIHKAHNQAAQPHSQVQISIYRAKPNPEPNDRIIWVIPCVFKRKVLGAFLPEKPADAQHFVPIDFRAYCLQRASD